MRINESRWIHEKSKAGFLMSSHPLTDFEIQTFYENNPKLNVVNWKNKLLTIKDGAYIINIDEYESIGTH